MAIERHDMPLSATYATISCRERHAPHTRRRYVMPLLRRKIRADTASHAAPMLRRKDTLMLPLTSDAIYCHASLR